MTGTYIDIHILQTVPPSNLNRDDAGSPKQAVYGGVRRARVSSQAWKRATRKAFEDHVPEAQLATRTKRISTLLSDRLSVRTGLDTEVATRIATAALVPLKIKAGKKATDTAYLLFFGLPQLERIVDLVADRVTELAALTDEELAAALKDLPVQEQLGRGHPLEVALFGRMVAEIPDLNVDAATQVAHALSTHAVETEFDYFTAVDDENTDDTGAGIIGTVEFNSSTLYRFATLGVDQLLENLGGDPAAALSGVGLFLTTFVTSMPTGYKNCFAHQTLPNLVTVVIRGDQPVNLVSAFEQPVLPQEGLVEESVRRLSQELSTANDLWGRMPIAVHSTYSSAEANATLGPPLAFPELVTTVTAAVGERLMTGSG